MELQRLISMLERATFQERQAVAAAAARTATPASLRQIARLLVHPHQPVRLGAIEILAATRFRPALDLLVEASLERDGDERVFAARAVAHLAEPGDRERLEPVARAWLAVDDALLHVHAGSLLATLAGDPAAPSADGDAAPAEPAAAVPAGLTSADRAVRNEAIARACANLGEPGPILAGALLGCRHPGARLDLVTALEGLGAERLAAAAPRLLDQADGDVVALLARALRRHLPGLAGGRLALLRPALDRARRRQGSHAMAREALDECLLAAPDQAAIAALASRVDTLAPATARGLAERLAALPAARRQEHMPALIAALGRMPRRALLFCDILRSAWPQLGPSERAALRRLLDEAGAQPLPGALSAGALARIGQLYAATLSRGDQPPRPVLQALEAPGTRTAPEVAQAAIAVYRAMATEASARRLATYLEASAKPEHAREDVRAAARAALEALAVPHVKIIVAGDGTARVVPDYHTPAGEPLFASHGVLATADGVRYVLDASGQPVPERATAWGGCRCCERPHALVRNSDRDSDRGTGPGRRPACPETREPHLIQDGASVLEREHPLGGCTACGSLRPLVRHDAGTGPVVRCDECHTEHMRVGGRYIKRGRARRRAAQAEDVEPLERPGPLSKRDLPEPPSASDLRLVEPAIAHAMAANVFLVGETAALRWAGSGVVVARHGNEIAILTNRHVVEDEAEDGRLALARVHVYTIAGELVPAEVRWRAGRGLDLAMVVARLQAPERAAITLLQEGSCLVGSRLFAIGNPLGLSWSYSSGTLAAFRTWQSQGGLDIRFIQSHVTMSGGSSGGGLYHEQGHLVGINSFGHGSTGPGGDHNFSISMPSVLGALRREAVTFAGKRLVED